jgi:hypothetical protein
VVETYTRFREISSGKTALSRENGFWNVICRKMMYFEEIRGRWDLIFSLEGAFRRFSRMQERFWNEKRGWLVSCGDIAGGACDTFASLGLRVVAGGFGSDDG